MTKKICSFDSNGSVLQLPDMRRGASVHPSFTMPHSPTARLAGSTPTILSTPLLSTTLLSTTLLFTPLLSIHLLSVLKQALEV